jgi:5-formyltetrahydrofolate cyclo-ligase
MCTLSEQKDRLRKRYLDLRKNLRDSVVLEKSERIFEKVMQSQVFQKAEWIHCFVSIRENKEVETHDFLRECLKLGKSVAVPKMSKGGRLKHIHLRSLDNLKENNWGVPEPADGVDVPVESFSFIIVPMVAGDRDKNRLGYGKGYYDRFLAESNAVKAGVLFDCQLHDTQLPVEPFDVSLDILFTESEKIG